MLQKTFNEKLGTCTTTFVLPQAIKANQAEVVGDFNSWRKGQTPMKRNEEGQWKAQVILPIGQEMSFRYLVNGSEWHLDWDADKEAAHPYGGSNSVVVTRPEFHKEPLSLPD